MWIWSCTVLYLIIYFFFTHVFLGSKNLGFQVWPSSRKPGPCWRPLERSWAFSLSWVVHTPLGGRHPPSQLCPLVCRRCNGRSLEEHGLQKHKRGWTHFDVPPRDLRRKIGAFSSSCRHFRTGRHSSSRSLGASKRHCYCFVENRNIFRSRNGQKSCFVFRSRRFVRPSRKRQEEHAERGCPYRRPGNIFHFY